MIKNLKKKVYIYICDVVKRKEQENIKQTKRNEKKYI